MQFLSLRRKISIQHAIVMLQYFEIRINLIENNALHFRKFMQDFSNESIYIRTKINKHRIFFLSNIFRSELKNVYHWKITYKLVKEYRCLSGLRMGWDEKKTSQRTTLMYPIPYHGASLIKKFLSHDLTSMIFLFNHLNFF
jgi:hypothetical protein